MLRVLISLFTWVGPICTNVLNEGPRIFNILVVLNFMLFAAGVGTEDDIEFELDPTKWVHVDDIPVREDCYDFDDEVETQDWETAGWVASQERGEQPVEQCFQVKSYGLCHGGIDRVETVETMN